MKHWRSTNKKCSLYSEKHCRRAKKNNMKSQGQTVYESRDEKYLAKGVAACDYVAFVCKEEIFPGQIVSVQKDGCLIKSMLKSGFHGMWPKHEDILLYLFEDVKREIAAPQARKRGASAVPELDFIWGISTLILFSE